MKLLLAVMFLSLFFQVKLDADNLALHTSSTATTTSQDLVWTRKTKLWSQRDSHSALSFNNKLWIIGGNGYNSNEIWSSSDGIYWNKAIEPAPWGKLSEHTSVVFNNKIWVLGGSDYYSGENNDVWSSIDGISWVKEANAQWSPRRRHTSVVFNNKIWVLGGIKKTADGGSTLTNEVWSSSDGTDWTKETGVTFPRRYDHTSVVFNNKLWVLGGMAIINNGAAVVGYANDVWSSSDGINWNQETNSAAWSVRGNHTSAVFDNKIWLMGGNASSGSTRYNDIWSSTDGTSWVQETDATWSGRKSHASTVFNNKLWITGGNTGYYGNDNEVWSSSNGVDWIRQDSIGLWAGRSAHSSLVFNNKMWILGGISGNYQNDIWSSVDGINWVKEVNNAPWEARGSHTSVVFNNKMWVMGGGVYYNNGTSSGTAYKNDVWSSPDGINWTLETTAPWHKRAGHASVVFNNKIWVIGGYWLISGVGYEYLNDVWSTPDGINWTKKTTALWSSGRIGHSSLIFNNKIWVLGGVDEDYTNTNDEVWSSADGVTWVKEVEDALWSPLRHRNNHSSLVFNNKIWLFSGSGVNAGARHADVWSSIDGITWEHKEGLGVTGHTNLVFGNGIYILGGSGTNDTWLFQPQNYQNQTIIFSPPSLKKVGDNPFTISAIGGGSNKPVIFTTTTTTNAICTISGDIVTIISAGTCTVTAKQNGDLNYNSAPQVSESITITKANQTISFNPPASKSLDDATFDIAATATSGLTVSFTSTTTHICTVSGSTISLLMAGICTIEATQSGNDSYNQTPQVSENITITSTNQTGNEVKNIMSIIQLLLLE